ncbi:MAG: arsenate reductase ArsC [Pyrinomonadaceae bacterium]|nr:arsenate reductase ArsC [Pyrinomonadaceae bacterium]
MKDKKSILVLCTGNSARSQMAEGLLRHSVGDEYEVISAGTEPSLVRPEAIRVMAELGIDLSNHRSKSVDEFRDKKIDFVLTVCDNARENCPYFPAESKLIHHAFPDPAGATGDDDTRDSAFREVRDLIRNYISEFLKEISQ